MISSVIIEDNIELDIVVKVMHREDITGHPIMRYKSLQLRLQFISEVIDMSKVRNSTIDKIKSHTGEIEVGDIHTIDGVEYHFGQIYGWIHQVGNTTYGVSYDDNDSDWSEWDNSHGHNSPHSVAETH